MSQILNVAGAEISASFDTPCGDLVPFRAKSRHGRAAREGGWLKGLVELLSRRQEALRTAEDLTSRGRCSVHGSRYTSKAPVCRQLQASCRPCASACGICRKPRLRGRPARGNACGYHG